MPNNLRPIAVGGDCSSRSKKMLTASIGRYNTTVQILRISDHEHGR